MTLKQRALVQTVLTVLGITAIGIAGGLISTLMTPLMFYGILTAIAFGFMFYLIYSWNVTSLEMEQRFAKMKEDR
jgi:zinc transporter ZupT